MSDLETSSLIETMEKEMRVQATLAQSTGKKFTLTIKSVSHDDAREIARVLRAGQKRHTDERHTHLLFGALFLGIFWGVVISAIAMVAQ